MGREFGECGQEKAQESVKWQSGTTAEAQTSVLPGWRSEADHGDSSPGRHPTRSSCHQLTQRPRVSDPALLPSAQSRWVHV